MELKNHAPKFVLLEREKQKHFLETLIFSSEQKLTLKNILDILSEKDAFFEAYLEDISSEDSTTENQNESESKPEVDEEVFDEMMMNRFALNNKYIKLLIDEINIELEQGNRPFRIVDFAGGYQYSTLSEYGELVASVIRAKSRKRLSNVQLETLAIVAYKQPVTNPEVEQIRGVKSKDAINTLIDKGFVSVVGRSDKVGKPLLYGTTELFLETFGLASLKDLPNLKEISEITSDAPSEEELAKVKINPTTMEKDDTNEIDGVETQDNDDSSADLSENETKAESTDNDRDELIDKFIVNK